MILVVGGTGRLGSLLVARLTDRGMPVRVLTRNPDRAHGSLPAEAEIVRGDVRHAPDLAAAADGVQLVVSAVQGLTGRHGSSPASVDRDGNRNLVEAAQGAGAEVVLVSVVGAAADSPMELFRMKYAAEQQLMASGAPYTIVQASAFLELWVDLLAQSAKRGGRPVILGHGGVRRNFVSVRDVAALVDEVVMDPGARGKTVQIVGPQNLTLNELALALQTAAGRTSAPRHVPSAVLRIAASTVGLVVPVVGRVLRASLAQDQLDLTSGPTGVREVYPGIPCTTLEQSLAAR